LPLVKYTIGFIYTRCFLQKAMEVNGAQVIPLFPTGGKGEIHNAKALLEHAGFPFTRKYLDSAIENFKKVGQSVVVKFSEIEAGSAMKALEIKKTEAEAIAKALAAVSANPATLLCTYAKSSRDSGVDFAFPNDRIIRHPTNAPGYLEVLPYFANAAKNNPKASLLLSLYRASLRENDIDYRILFQLILLEEASDQFEGTLAERMRQLFNHFNLDTVFSQTIRDLNIEIPPEKDIVDALVKLRNAAAHNGRIDEESLKEFKAGWLVPLVQDKDKFHKLIGESIRFTLCHLCGFNIDEHAIRLEGGETGAVFEIRFD